MSTQIASSSFLWIIVLALVFILFLNATLRSISPNSNISVGNTHQKSVSSNLKSTIHSSSIGNIIQNVMTSMTKRRRLQEVDADLDLEAENSKGEGLLSALNKRFKKRQQNKEGSNSNSNNKASEKDTSKPAILRCHNQTQCIPPKLQLQRSFNVYYCKHIAYGVRFFYLIREGLLLHPLINLVDSPEAADYLVYLPVSAEWEKSECNKDQYRNKTIVLDEGDWPQLFDPPTPSTGGKFPLYFKRSYVQRSDGMFQRYMGYLEREDVLPLTYTIMEAYVRSDFNLLPARNIDIVCTLRGGPADPARDRIRRWVEEYGKSRELKSFIAGEVNHASRTVVSRQYIDDMHRAKVIVTVNPSGWEGDFRLMEALGSGALVMVDHMYVPRPDPLIHGKHIIYYGMYLYYEYNLSYIFDLISFICISYYLYLDNRNRTELFEQLDRYLKDVNAARRIAVYGYIHSMKHHRAANLIDYVFRSLHVKLMRTGGALGAGGMANYTMTGFDMRNKAIERARALKAARRR